MESGFQIDYVKKKLYQYKSSVDEAIEQLRKHNPSDDYEAHPVYWYGRLAFFDTGLGDLYKTHNYNYG